ncbi:hypothetical protein [uncultured Lactococcus sp.]|uniref:hypothetical protein n=1 Tax=uncultured Lactococcus sp. TaxID=167973 RepID=UPI0027DC2B80|nr:hypothetical protein [uncultured Lactococcus sp.]
MNKEQKRKLALIAVLGAALLVGGTFAFQAFNQQAINDRLRDNEVEVGGRVHDYYNRETENKDVFVENYGQEEIMARIRLSEFMEIQERGQSSFTPIVAGTSRADVTSWTTWKPSALNLDNREGVSNAFDEFSNLTFGWQRGTGEEAEFAPWYLPTFNLDERDDRTASAGHARDYFTSNVTDGVTNGATHPGDGTGAYWTEDSPPYDNTDGEWFGSQVMRNVEQHVQQERPAMTMEQWEHDLSDEEKIGDFWVIDHQTGWAYWASKVRPKETTSYLLDAAQMTEEADNINGSYYYGIHVSSHLVSPEESDDFLESDSEGEHHEHLPAFLEGIRNNAMDEGWNLPPLPSDNPPANQNRPPGDFNFGIMNPGRLFTMGGQQFRYLENQGGGNHLIILESVILNVTWNNQNAQSTTWYNNLTNANPDIEEMVQPVVITAPVFDTAPTWSGGTAWRVGNLSGAAADNHTRAAETGGTKRAFSLSLADVNRVSGAGRGFANLQQRVGSPNSRGWWIRTPSHGTNAWHVNDSTSTPLGGLNSWMNRNQSFNVRGVRPALIIWQREA